MTIADTLASYRDILDTVEILQAKYNIRSCKKICLHVIVSQVTSLTNRTGLSPAELEIRILKPRAISLKITKIAPDPTLLCTNL